jgi:hypothetical protein
MTHDQSLAQDAAQRLFSASASAGDYLAPDAHGDGDDESDAIPALGRRPAARRTKFSDECRQWRSCFDED